MKTLLATIILAGLLSCQSSKPGFRSVSVDDFQHLITDSSVIRLDVRTAKEFDDGHIPNAVNIDVLQPDFLQKALSSLPQNIQSPLIAEAENEVRKLLKCSQRKDTRS